MERGERPHDLGINRLRMEQADLLGGVDYGARPNSIHYQFLLEHQARGKSERQPVGSDDARMDGAFAAAAWKFRHYAGCISRPLRIQPPWSRTRLNHAK